MRVPWVKDTSGMQTILKLPANRHTFNSGSCIKYAQFVILFQLIMNNDP